MTSLSGDVSEIRINNSYASLLNADYTATKKGDSIPKTRKKTILTDTYIQKLLGKDKKDTGMLPPNCRFLEKFTNGAAVVIEEPPSVRSIASDMAFGKVLERLKESGKLDEYGYDYDTELNAERPRIFTLAMPFTIFILTIGSDFSVTSGQVFFRNKQLSGLGDYLLKAPFSNISENGYICFGDRIYQKKNSLYGAIQHAQQVWWSTIFNADYTHNIDSYNKVPGLCDYYTWQYLSNTNPLFIYSAKWIKVGVTLGQRLQNTTQSQHLQSQNENAYRILSKAFSSTVPTGKLVKPYARARKLLPLYYDMAQGFFMSPSICAHVGDAFRFKNKELVHIDNYIGFENSDFPHLVRINKNGKLFTMKLTSKVKSFISRQITKYITRTNIKIHDKVVKKGEILVFKSASGNDIYKKVKTIRKAVDGKMELHIGGEYYLSDYIPEFKKYDPTKINIYGRSIKPGDQFILLNNPENMVPLFPGARVEFNKTDIDKNDRLSFKFKDMNKERLTRTYNILSTNVQKSRLIDPNGVENVKGVFRIGRILLRNTREDISEIWKTPYGFIKESIARTEHPPFDFIKKEVLKDDELFIQSYDFDISFKIGDKVVVSDWDNPLNMLSIKMIQGFKVDDAAHTISLIFQDKYSNLSEHVYIRNSFVKIGTVRKVANSYNKIKVGTKIIAKTAGIPCFHKKDANIIVAFITDTGIDEPLVLCSNCCTLWFSDMMENFDRITMRARKWKELPHADIDLSKIGFQPGDIVTASKDFKNDHGYMLFNDHPRYEGNQMKAHSLGYYHQYNEHFYLDRRLMRELKFDCIISPRIKILTLSEMKTKPCFPNFHGVYSIVSPNLSDFYFPLNLGRMIDVSNFYK